MPDGTSTPIDAIESQSTPDALAKPSKQQPTAETIKHLRHQIEERKPEAMKIFTKSGTTPTGRELINAAGKILRDENEAGIDPMTGALNRLGYGKKRNQALEQARHNNTPLTAAAIDLDDLKRVNDTQGHDAGDLYITNAASALRDVSRLTDLVARKGGDEFEVLLIDSDPEGAAAWEARARERLKELGVNASIGISPVDISNADQSFQTADERMYIEKRAKKQAQHPGLIRRISTPIVKFLRRAS